MGNVPPSFPLIYSNAVKKCTVCCAGVLFGEGVYNSICWEDCSVAHDVDIACARKCRLVGSDAITVSTWSMVNAVNSE